MKRKITLLIAAAASLGVTLIAAGCGSSASGPPYSSAPYGSAAVPNANAAATRTAKVDVANTPLGRILTDGRGRTLYLFEEDKGRASSCYFACASTWPPFTTKGKPQAGHGLLVRELGTTKRSDGTLEVTVNGHLLYYFAGDSKRGDSNGQGLEQFGAEWYVLSPAGNKVERQVS